METGVLRGRKILFISNTDFNLYNFRLPLMKALISSGVRVWAVAPRGKYTEKIKQEGIEFCDWRLTRGSLNPVLGLRAVFSLKKIIERVKPDLVQAFVLGGPILFTGLAKKIMRGRFGLVASVTGLGALFLEEGLRWKMMRIVLNPAFKLAFLETDRVIFQNGDDLERLVREGLVARDKAQIIRGSGVDVSYFRPGIFSEKERLSFRRRWGIPKRAVVVLMVARLIKEKGVYEFIEVARRFEKEKVFFVLVGGPDPGNPSSLSQSEIEQLNKEKTLLLPGFQDDVRPWLASADIYVLPSYYPEGLPLSVLEAMAIGLPVVTTDVPGCRDTVEEGVNGFLVPPREVEALEKAIRTLVEDAGLRRRMGEASRRKAVKEFSVDQVVRAHLELYNEMLSHTEICTEGRRKK